MEKQHLCVNADTGDVRLSNVGKDRPTLVGILGTRLQLAVTFERLDKPIELPEDTTGRIVLKQAGQESGSVILGADSWTQTGTGLAAVYDFSFVADSEGLRTIINGKGAVVLLAQIEWQLDAEDEPRKSMPFMVTVIDSPARPDDGAPDPAGSAAWAWIKSRLVAGSNVTLTINEDAQTITIASSGGGGGPAVTWTTLEGKPSTFPPSTHGHTWTQITGSPSDNATLVSFVMSLAGGEDGLVFDYFLPVLNGSTEQNEFTTGNVPAVVFPRAGSIKTIEVILIGMRPYNEGVGFTTPYVFSGAVSLGSAVDAFDYYDDLWDGAWTFMDTNPDYRQNIVINLLEPLSNVAFTPGAKINLAVESVPGVYGTPTFLGVALRIRGLYNAES